LDAEHFYEQAIRSAHANGFVHNEALANELAARFYAARGFGKIAHAYLQEARYCYSRWGADGKVLQLDRLYPRLRDVEPVPGRATTIATPVENLDLATVIRVAQAVSGEIALPKLIQNLARIAIEHAGADRGLLILLRGNHPHIEAEATTGHGRAAVTVRGTAVTPFDLPQSALQYVIRTHERVLLDDASVGNLYSEDEYIRRKRPRSVLFVPIVKQTKLMGALYLENTLTPCVFTPDRVTVLELLALQASISLENASLYSDLQRSEAFLAEGQGISHTGSFGWKVANGEIHWSAETYNIFEEDRAVKPTVEMILRRTHPDDRDLVEQTLDRACEAKADFDVEHRLLMSDGSVKHLHVLARALTTSSENLEFVGAVTDTTATKQAEEALRASERSLRLIVDTIPGMTATMTAEGEIELLNQQILDYTGKTTEEMRHWPPLIHPDDRAVVKTQWSHSVQTGEPYDNQHRILRADGVYRWFQVRGQPLRNKEGRIVRWYMLMSDIEERKQAEEKLRRSEADLLEAQRLSHTGNWKHDIASGTFTVSPEVYRMFGASPDDDSSGLGFWVERVHPEDQKRTQTLFERSVIDKTDYLADYRIVLPDGTIRRQHAFGRPILNASGDLVEFVGTTMDVTEQWQARAALVEAFEEIKRLKDRLEEENVALREEIDKASMFEEIVGVSAPIQRVLSHISKVARTDSNVLVTGETGTGKELVARAIHRTSQRSSHPFVSVNCAAIPRDLIASELFGHERGAFTGATQRRLGRFEVADKGTIFLDEIGELPPETQIALLRVLQEHEFERVGGTESIRTDARIIAATNRDLEAAIAGGMFRSDLFYRLNVFPIEVPPLRKRREDIPMLVEYFIDRYARKAGKTFRSVNKRSLDLLQSYPWPGNIRELQNVIERSVIMCESETFSVDNGWLSRRGRESEQNSKLNPFRELASQEKVIIEAALRASRGRVYGPAGAAARLGMPRSTLESKIRSLKINKSRFKDTDPSNTA
jgi:PAS domain S-box-containing protein